MFPSFPPHPFSLLTFPTLNKKRYPPTPPVAQGKMENIYPYLVTLGLEFSDSLGELRNRRTYVRQLDDVPLGGLGQSTKPAQVVGLPENKANLSIESC